MAPLQQRLPIRSRLPTSHGSVSPITRMPAPRLRVQQAASAQVVTAPSQKSIEDLLAWARKQGTSTDKVSISTAVEDGRPILVAAKDLGAGEEALTINDAAWLSPATVAKSSIGKAVAGLEPWLQVALLILAARNGAASDFAPYVSSLPAQPQTPLFWSNEQLRMLQGTQLLDSLAGYRAFFEAKYTELFGPQGRLSGQTVLFGAGGVTLQQFIAAVATVRSRSHAPLEGDSLALVPVADMVSHRRSGNTQWKAKSAGLFGKGQTLVVETTRAVRKGEELTMDYAPGKLDSSVLLDYGVMDSQQLQPGYDLTLSLDQTDRLLDDKLNVVETFASEGLAPTMQFPLTPNTTPTEVMQGFLRLKELKGGDVFLLESVFSNDVWGFMCEPVSEDNEKAVCSAMVTGAQAALDRYQTSIDEDLALLRSGSVAPGSPEEQAIRVRLGEKEALDTLQQWFDERSKTLKRLAYYQERRLRRLGLIDDEGRTTYDSFFKDGIA